MEYYENGKLKLEHHPTGDGNSNETEYYPSGKIKRKQLLDELGVGTINEYYPNGVTRTAMVYGKRSDSRKETGYFPDGALYYKKSYFKNGDYGFGTKFEECRDSTGKILTQNGKGFWITYNDNFTLITEQGKVVNGLQDSVWKIAYSTTEGEIDTYKKGELIKSQLYPIRDNTITSNGDQVPEFPGGLDAFFKFLGKNIRYPANARENGTQGRIIISFVVEKDGSLTDVKVVKGIGDGCDEEAVRVIKMSPKWNPGVQDGKPVRVKYSVPIAFAIDNSVHYVQSTYFGPIH
jgi:TonB family protein